MPGHDAHEALHKGPQEQVSFSHGSLFVNDSSLLVFQSREITVKTKCSNKQAILCQEKVEFYLNLSPHLESCKNIEGLFPLTGKGLVSR